MFVRSFRTGRTPIPSVLPTGQLAKEMRGPSTRIAVPVDPLRDSAATSSRAWARCSRRPAAVRHATRIARWGFDAARRRRYWAARLNAAASAVNVATYADCADTGAVISIPISAISSLA